MGCSPQGIFTGLPQIELDSLRANALAVITGGRWANVSGGAKSGSRDYGMSPQDILAEVKFAEQQNGTRPARAQKVIQVLSTCPPYPFLNP